MRILIYENNINGHRLEYLHHLHDVASLMPEHRFVFALPEAFVEKKQMFEWKELTNVSYDLSVKQAFTEPGNGNPIRLLKSSYRKCKELMYYVNKHDANSVFVNTIIHYVPCFPLVVTGKTQVTGVLYNIYLRDERKGSFVSSMINKIKYKVMAKGKGFGQILVLNDKESADRLNQLYKTRRFQFIPDPYTPIPISESIDIRKEFNIPECSALFSHFGGLQGRKGTMDILDSISLLTEEEKSQYVFFFAGKVYKDIEVKFKERVKELQASGYKIIFQEGFCSYEFLAALCKASDAILIPYRKTSQSSGLIGYASQFATPVIAPSTGLIGHLVKKYGLGYCIEDCNPTSLVESYKHIYNKDIVTPSDEYCLTNSVSGFVDVTIEALSK